MKIQDKATMKKAFQSYLLITPEDAQEATINFLKSLNITISQNSPDLSIVTPEKESVSIEESREIKKLIFQRPIESKHKIIVIPNAHTLSYIVQNSLLKTLEEPPNMAIIILIATTTKNILPTILSRVVTVNEEPSTTAKNTGQDFSIETLADLAKIEDPKSWIDFFLISQYQILLKTTNNNDSMHKIQKSIEIAQETKNMITANVNPKFALMSLWLRTR